MARVQGPCPTKLPDARDMRADHSHVPAFFHCSSTFKHSVTHSAVVSNRRHPVVPRLFRAFLGLSGFGFLRLACGIQFRTHIYKCGSTPVSKGFDHIKESTCYLLLIQSRFSFYMYSAGGPGSCELALDLVKREGTPSCVPASILISGKVLVCSC